MHQVPYVSVAALSGAYEVGISTPDTSGAPGYEVWSIQDGAERDIFHPPILQSLYALDAERSSRPVLETQKAITTASPKNGGFLPFFWSAGIFSIFAFSNSF